MSTVKTPTANVNDTGERYHRTEIIKLGAVNFDAEANVLRDVVICQVGEAKGHGTHLDQTFIEEVVRLGNLYPQGLKSRFGHPNMSTESLGTYTGRLKEFNVQGGQAKANFHLDPVSKNSPQGNLHDWIIEMSASNPDMLGMSIVFMPGDYFQYDAEGKKVVIKDYYERDKNKPLYETIVELFGADLVDDPAATESLFSAKFNADKFAVQVTAFLDEHPDIWEAVQKKPELWDRIKGKYEEYASKKKTNVSMAKKEVKLTAKAEAALNKLKAKAEPKNFDVTADTTEGETIHIITAGTEPAVGDQVNIVNADGTESPAPDNTYVINGGEYDGWTCVVVNGVITEVTQADVTAPDVQEPTATPTVSNSADDEKVKALEEKLTKLEKTIKETPAAEDTVVAEEGDNDFLSAKTQKLSAINKEGLEVFEKYKKHAASMIEIED